MVEAFTSVAYLLSAFLVVFGIVFFWLAYQTTNTSSGLVGFRFSLIIFGLLYFALAHFSVLSGLAYGVELTNRAPCENVVNQSVYNETYTTYTYEDSCVGRTTPESANRLFKVYTWLLYIDLFALMFGGFFAWFKGWLRRW